MAGCESPRCDVWLDPMDSAASQLSQQQHLFSPSNHIAHCLSSMNLHARIDYVDTAIRQRWLSIIHTHAACIANGRWEVAPTCVCECAAWNSALRWLHTYLRSCLKKSLPTPPPFPGFESSIAMFRKREFSCTLSRRPAATGPPPYLTYITDLP